MKITKITKIKTGMGGTGCIVQGRWLWFFSLCLAITLAAAAEPEPPAPAPEQAAAAEQAEVAEQVPVIPPAPPLENFQEALDRPLFYSTRRPREIEDDDGTAADEQQLRETWKLSGVVFEGGQPRALFAQREGDRRISLGIGMPLDQHWILEEIQPDGVILVSDELSVHIELREPRALESPAGKRQENAKAAENGAQGTRAEPDTKAPPASQEDGGASG